MIFCQRCALQNSWKVPFHQKLLTMTLTRTLLISRWPIPIKCFSLYWILKFSYHILIMFGPRFLDFGAFLSVQSTFNKTLYRKIYFNWILLHSELVSSRKIIEAILFFSSHFLVLFPLKFFPKFSHIETFHRLNGLVILNNRRKVYKLKGAMFSWKWIFRKELGIKLRA